MATGPQYLFGSVPGTGPSVWFDADCERPRAGFALRQRDYDAANERNAAVRCGKRCLPLSCTFAYRLQPSNTGHRYHIHGIARGGCSSIRELSTDGRGLGKNPLASMRISDSETAMFNGSLF